MSVTEPTTTHDLTAPQFVAHEGGKLEVRATKALRDQHDLSLLYTPGVADVCLAIQEDPDLSRRFTARNNTVAIVTDGTAVLGLGDIGPAAAMPVMEGKAVLFKTFAGVDAIPMCLESGSVDELVDSIVRIAPSFGGINLEDISAPRCFDLERRLRERLDIPVFHDDQHGTAIVVLAGLINACRVTDRQISSLKIVVGGAGAAGVAVTQLLQLAGATDVLVCDSRGIIGSHRNDLVAHKEMLAATTNASGRTGGLGDALVDADVYIGVSGGSVPEEQVAAMAEGPMIFALANPTPEVHPDLAHKYASVVATGRSDYPNQINNVLAFPGIFRGALDAGGVQISDEMKLAAARAIADMVAEPTAEQIVPPVFQDGVAEAVAAAVAAHAV
ncbi:NAD(P)-dependent malic enzyme [Janibacter corallicola]|uniref:NAD(P)-dependent malic enzyme n=1 Tax=Janibacter corallicola TaxID=415212 RepID=UPI000AA6776B|nr:NADP-dependent malic enzyme [Janibacter corallicola]